ncbi:MAG: RNA-splicing ligase RtcB [Marinilabiliales bacterium]
MKKLSGKYTSAKIMTELVDRESIAQIELLINNPAFINPVCIMPDVHKGIGSVIGFTMKLPDKVVPNVIGVDIGCGILTVCIGENLRKSLSEIDKIIKQVVPLGFKQHQKKIVTKIDFSDANKSLKTFYGKFNKVFDTRYKPEAYNEKWLSTKVSEIGVDLKTFYNSIGTLGGGNHFIEIGQSINNNNYYVTIHSGSRHFGLKIANYWQKIANDYVRNNAIKGVSKELSYLQDLEMMGYLTDMVFAQYYAKLNRETILKLILEKLNFIPGQKIESVHNYIDPDDMFIRKGAIRSYINELMVIPLNMRDGILICEGKSNPEWNYSAPHGAGRLLSRRQAFKKVNLQDFIDSMKNVYSTSINKKTIDESPFAYKPRELIEKSLLPTCNIIDKILPVINIKA